MLKENILDIFTDRREKNENCCKADWKIFGKDKQR